MTRLFQGGKLLRTVNRSGAAQRLYASGAATPGARAGKVTVGQLMRQPYDEQLGTVPTASGAGWLFNLPGNAQPMTDYKRRLETQWVVDGNVPHYKYGSIIQAEFTLNGNLGAAAQPTTQDHWHVASQLYGPSDNPMDQWGPGFVSHGISIKNGKITWSGGGSHQGQQYTQSGTYEYFVDLDDYVDGKDYRIKVVACLADDPDGWLSVWCNGKLWSKGEKWRPVGTWQGVENGNRVGVMWTREPWNWLALRNGIYRGTNSGEADRPTYTQSITCTVHYLSPQTQTPAAELAIPKYNTVFSDDFSGTLAKWTADAGVTVSGGVMSMPASATAASATTVSTFAPTGSVSQFHITAAPATGAEIIERVQSSATPGDAAVLRFANSRVYYRVEKSGQAVPAWTDTGAWDWYHEQYGRIREKDGSWVFEVSLDGWTWHLRGSLPSTWTAAACQVKLTSSGTGGSTTVDDVIVRVPA